MVSNKKYYTAPPDRNGELQYVSSKKASIETQWGGGHC